MCTSGKKTCNLREENIVIKYDACQDTQCSQISHSSAEILPKAFHALGIKPKSLQAP